MAIPSRPPTVPAVAAGRTHPGHRRCDGGGVRPGVLHRFRNPWGRPARRLHNADAALRSATVVRSQVGLATHLSVLEGDFGFDAATRRLTRASSAWFGKDEPGATVPRMASTTAAVVLAGGASRRLGYPKQLIPYRGRPLLEHVVHSVLSWSIDQVVVVLGASAEEILEAVDFDDAVVAINDDWEEGIASSLRVGLDVLSRDPHIDLAFVVLGDQPGIPPDVPAVLLEAAASSSRLVIAPVYRYERSNPLLFRRQLWERLMTLEGDQGAAALLKAHPDWVEDVRVDYLPPKDIDTTDDVADLAAGAGRPDVPPASGR